MAASPAWPQVTPSARDGTPLYDTLADLAAATAGASTAATGAITDAANVAPGTSGTVISWLKGIVTQLAGVLKVDGESAKATYSASLSTALATSANVAWQFQGSATKKIRIRRVRLSFKNATPAVVDVLLTRYSSAATGGTSGAVNMIKHDTTSAAATGALLAFTVDPTAGTGVGRFRTNSVIAGNATTPPVVIDMDFGLTAQAIVLKDNTEFLGINLNGTATAGTTMNHSVEWTEE